MWKRGVSYWLATGSTMSEKSAVVLMRQSSVTICFSLGHRFSRSMFCPPRTRRSVLPPAWKSTRGGTCSGGRSLPAHQPSSTASRMYSAKGRHMLGSAQSERCQTRS